MATPKRKPGPDLRERLLKQFYSFSFFQAVGLIEAMSPQAEPLGKGLVPSREAVRFKVKPGFSFPASDITDLKKADEKGPFDLSVTFMGLVGPSGVLPQWYNSLAEERLRQKDKTLTDFFDIFHHHLITLMYLAWKKGRLPENYTPGTDDPLSSYLLSLAGLGTKGLSDMLGLPKEALAFYTGMLSRQVPSAAAIEASVSYLAGTRVKVEQFLERSIALSEEDCTKIGALNSALGVNTICGSCVKDRQSAFRINLGPMTFKEYRRFLPETGDLIRPIFFLVKYMVGMEFEFDIRIILAKEEIPGCELGREGVQLGWTTWLKSPVQTLAREASLLLSEEEIMRGKAA